MKPRMKPPTTAPGQTARTAQHGCNEAFQDRREAHPVDRPIALEQPKNPGDSRQQTGNRKCSPEITMLA